MLRLPTCAPPVTYLVRFRGPRDSSSLRARRCWRSRDGWRTHLGPGSLFNRRIPLPVRSRVDVSGTSQVPRRSILCLATTPARLASGWLARLYREGVEPSGSLQKVSDRSLILLFWIYPGAREVSFRNLPSHHSITSSARASKIGGTSKPKALAVFRLTTNSRATENRG